MMTQLKDRLQGQSYRNKTKWHIIEKAFLERIIDFEVEEEKVCSTQRTLTCLTMLCSITHRGLRR